MTTTIDQVIDAAEQVVNTDEQRQKLRAIKTARTHEQVAALSLYPIPSEAVFEGEFCPAPDLEKLADELIETHSMYAGECTVTYLWRDHGGRTKGKSTLGKCQKPSGLLRHFSHADFVIWLAADHLRESGATRKEVEAVLYHELCHIDGEEDEETGETEAVLRGHDYEGFLSELQHYGTTVRDLRPVVAQAQQLSLEIAPA